ncbi:MAG: hypothetical protein HYS13_15800, partial [Planctomycetia bacterium]|nr:hypothetical protein [Planctomycetia bacterium]
MARKKRVIRRIERTSVADFDEQLWPINSMLFILAACAGTVAWIACRERFGDPRILYNGWTWMALLVLILAGLVGG